MPLIDSHSIIYIHIPKTGGTAITNCFAGHKDVPLKNGKLAPMESLVSDQVRDPGHHRWTHYASKYPKEWELYKRIATIRDPIDRFVSAFNYAKMENSWWHGSDKEGGLHPDYDRVSKMTIHEAAEMLIDDPLTFKHQSWLPQHYWICDNGEFKVDTIISYVGLREAFLDRFNIDLRIINTTDVKVSKVDQGLKDLIRSIYREDYKLLDFESDHPKSVNISS